MLQKKRILIPTNETGHPIGEYHHRALLTDAQVNEIRDLHEEEGLGYRKLAKMYGVSRLYIRDICTYRRRGVTMMGTRVVYVEVVKSEQAPDEDGVHNV